MGSSPGQNPIWITVLFGSRRSAKLGGGEKVKEEREKSTGDEFTKISSLNQNPLGGRKS